VSDLSVGSFIGSAPSARSEVSVRSVRGCRGGLAPFRPLRPRTDSGRRRLRPPATRPRAPLAFEGAPGVRPRRRPLSSSALSRTGGERASLVVHLVLSLSLLLLLLLLLSLQCCCVVRRAVSATVGDDDEFPGELFFAGEGEKSPRRRGRRRRRVRPTLRRPRAESCGVRRVGGGWEPRVLCELVGPLFLPLKAAALRDTYGPVGVPGEAGSIGPRTPSLGAGRLFAVHKCLDAFHHEAADASTCFTNLVTKEKHNHHRTSPTPCPRRTPSPPPQCPHQPRRRSRPCPRATSRRRTRSCAATPRSSASSPRTTAPRPRTPSSARCARCWGSSTTCTSWTTSAAPCARSTP